MNAKAESFKAFLEEKNINAFTIDEIKDDTLHTVVFRSQINIDGNNLPTLVIADDSVFAMIRIAVAPNVNEVSSELAALINTYNRTYKSFKYYVDANKALILDISLPTAGDALNGELIYALFDTVIRHLNETYKEIMKEIWK